MVRRKPVGQDNAVPPPLQQAADIPPYPITPVGDAPPPLPAGAPPAAPSQEDHPSSSFEFIGRGEAPKQNGEALSDHDDSDSDDWDKDDTEDEEEGSTVAAANDIPAPLKVGGSRDASPHPQPAPTLPAALRVGPAGGISPQLSQESLVSQESRGSNPWATTNQRQPSIPLKSNNPYLRKHSTGDGNPALASSSSVWADVPPTTAPAPVELPANQTPAEAFSQMSLNGGIQSKPPHDEPQTPFSRQPPLISVESEGGTRTVVNAPPQMPSARPPIPPAQDYSPVQGTPWDDQFGTDEATTKELAHMQQQPQESNPWESETNPPLPPRADDIDPHLTKPPRPGDEVPPPQPPRPQVDIPVTSTPPRTTDSPNTVTQKQRKEHYAIKHIRWYDEAAGKLRESPILIQNANGPCPLLALVNALVLSTHPASDTALIETLRTREQITLGLLLDAVFDELMSGRRGGAAQELPDVGELYQFLITLHTGMNVNPRFVPPAVEAPNLMDADGPLTDVHPALRQPGSFEETKEMKLYSTFNIPLIHGWLPSKGSEAYNAFNRAAKTFEDAQNIQFREEELDSKLSTTGLSPDEIHLFEDITSIKEFLNRWPTQLTDYGLDVLKQHLQPGSIAIFFRNDHFSTLYKDPRSGRLMALVTDAGYSTHEEIVWESLVDVNGRNGELFSGDFRPVGGPASAAASSSNGGPSSAGPAGPRSSSARPVRSMLDVGTPNEADWTTVTGKRRNNRPDPVHSRGDSGIGMAQETGVLHASHPPSSEAPPHTEQEDHDLALALQLQEEEQDRARRERLAQREREDRLSQQFLEGEGRAPQSPNVGARVEGGGGGGGGGGGAAGGGQDIRPLIPPRRNNQSQTVNGQQVTHTSEAAEDAPPPTYEQASRRPAYHPPANHPASPNAPIGAGRGQGTPRGQGAVRGGQRRRNSSAYFESQGQLPQGQSPAQQNTGRRRSSQHIPGGYPVGRGRGGPQYGGIGQGYSQPVGEDRDKCTVM